MACRSENPPLFAHPSEWTRKPSAESNDSAAPDGSSLDRKRASTEYPASARGCEIRDAEAAPESLEHSLRSLRRTFLLIAYAGRGIPESADPSQVPGVGGRS